MQVSHLVRFAIVTTTVVGESLTSIVSRPPVHATSSVRTAAQLADALS